VACDESIQMRNTGELKSAREGERK
jgi:hypothetical protein